MRRKLSPIAAWAALAGAAGYVLATNPAGRACRGFAFAGGCMPPTARSCATCPRYVAGLGHVRADPAVPAPHPEETLACQVVACRGCCCGTESKHPDIDHAAQAAALTELAPAAARVRVSGCLGHCDSSNNIVIIPSRQGRAADGTVTWIGYALSGEVTAAVADWVRAGGPGVAAMPSVLSAHVVDRRARAVR